MTTPDYTQDLVDSSGWDAIDHLPYSLDLALSDFQFFLQFKQYLGGKHFDNDEYV